MGGILGQENAYERFETVRLAADEALLKRFVSLLGAEPVVPARRECHLYELLRASETVGRMLTNQFYASYADIRQRVLSRLCRENAVTEILIGGHSAVPATVRAIATPRSRPASAICTRKRLEEQAGFLD